MSVVPPVVFKEATRSEWDAYVAEHPGASVTAKQLDALVQRVLRLENPTLRFRAREADETTEKWFDDHLGLPAPVWLVRCVHEFADAINEKNKERNTKIAALEAKVAALEARPQAPHYEGVFESGKAYGRDALVTHGGSMWIAKCPTGQRPGTGPDWQLCVKAGRDAREAR